MTDADDAATVMAMTGGNAAAAGMAMTDVDDLATWNLVAASLGGNTGGRKTIYF